AGIGNQSTIAESFLSLIHHAKTFDKNPILITGEKETFYWMDLEHLKGEKHTFSSLSELLDRFFYQKAARDRVKQQGNDLERFIRNERDKNINKIEKLKKTLDDAQQADRYQLLGELLTSNLYA
ncbi:NFACT family protein, partial [Micrococcus sp. SIMBA_144]